MKYFSKDEESRILQAIRDAENQTSGEIRVHVESVCEEDDVLDRAAWIFKELHMEQTALRNGVLIYVALKSKRFAIIGDVGINRLVPAGFWDSARDAMLTFLAQGDTAGGIVEAIGRVGGLLHEYFPRQDDDVNELPDTISTGR